MPSPLSSNTLSETEQPAAYELDAYDALLHEYVDAEGLVDYGELQANRADLDRFIHSMSGIDPDSFDAWPEWERLAFWINAYNSITLQRIVDRYPIKKGGLVAGIRYPANSIRQIPGVWTELSTDIMGRNLTLDAIEHEILRVEFREPRIHAAIVCAALSCPPLRNEAFEGARLDEQLADQSVKFFAGRDRFRIDRGKKKVYLSSILEWFGEDFVGVYNTGDEVTGQSSEEGAVLEYASRYVSPEDARFILNGKYSVSFLDYDWTLNEQ